jgi:predicted nucleotidyltransferase
VSIRAPTPAELERLRIVAPQVETTLAALRSHGCVVELFGSFARGEYRAWSDVDS